MFGSVEDDIRNKIEQRDTLWIFIFLCVAFYIVAQTIHLFSLAFDSLNLYSLFNSYLALPLNTSFFLKPWTIVTYLFLHASFFHVFMNMLMLYWFGSIYQLYIGNKYFTKVFLGGGVSGGLFSLLAYIFIPFLSKYPTVLVGASAGVEAIIFAATALNPEHEIRLLIFGRVKLKYIAFFSLLLNYLSIAGSNSGGVIAHLGGAFFGYLYMTQIQKGRDLFSFTNYISGFFNPSRKMKVTYRNTSQNTVQILKTDDTQEKVDAILDKISKSGYDSLSKQEKDFLFKYSNEK